MLIVAQLVRRMGSIVDFGVNVDARLDFSATMALTMAAGMRLGPDGQWSSFIDDRTGVRFDVTACNPPYPHCRLINTHMVSLL